MDLGVRPFVVASALAVVLGIAGIIDGRTVIATVSVILIILGVISFLLAVGLFFAEDEESPETGQGA